MVFYWLLVLAAFVLGLVVGRFWVTPIGVVAWLVFVAVRAHSGHNTMMLEPGLLYWLIFITSLFVLGGTVVGVLVRWVVRRMTAPQHAN
jgi:predicted membrane protein